MGTKISALTSAATLAGTESVPVVQGAGTRKTTVQEIANKAAAASPSILVETGVSTKTSAMSAASALAGTETVAVLQGGLNVKTTVQAIADLANTGMAVDQSSANSYTLVLADNNKYKEFTSGGAVLVTVPTNASVPFPIGAAIPIEQNGGGVVTVAAAGGVTIQSAGGLVATNGQYASAVLVKKDTNRWHLSGNLA